MEFGSCQSRPLKQRGPVAMADGEDDDEYVTRLSAVADFQEEMSLHLKNVGMKWITAATLHVMQNTAERNGAACRNTAWRILTNVEEGDYDFLPKAEKAFLQIVYAFRDLLERTERKELHGESKVLHLKIRADWEAYSAEFTDGHAKSQKVANAREAYAEATTVAVTDLVATHPIRMPFALALR